MIRKLFIAIIIPFWLGTGQAAAETAAGQMKQANKLMLDEDFEEALPIYLNLLDSMGSNPNLEFKAGLCYYKSRDQKHQALSYFQHASQKVSPGYHFMDILEKAAPIDVWFLLGEAYLFNQMPDSALYYYIRYQNLAPVNSPLPVQQRVNWCLNAKKMMAVPLEVKKENISNRLNSEAEESNPVATLDHSVIFFSSRRAKPEGFPGQIGQNDQDIYYAAWASIGKYSAPVYFPFNSGADEFPACVSADGKTLIFSREVKGQFDLYLTRHEEGDWQEPRPLGNNINGKSNETGASMTMDGQYLYFSSNRAGGQGGYDLYVSTRNNDQSWGKAKNLGKTINTPGDEVSPYIHPAGRTIFYSSNGFDFNGMGGLDIYQSEKENTGWSMPVNLEYPINTTRDDRDFSIISQGKRFYTAWTNYNSFDIMKIEGGHTGADEINITESMGQLRAELNVMEVMELEKEVEKEVQTTDILEVETEVEKEVEVTEIVEVETEVEIEKEVEKEMEVPNKDSLDEYSLEKVDLEKMDSARREAIVAKVKEYYSNQLAAGESAIFKMVYFQFNSAKLLLPSKNELKLLIEYMNEHPAVKVEVVGHTDILGEWGVNLRVSKERAQSVYKFLLNNDIPNNRIIYYGKGSASPIASNETEGGRAKNRRVEIVLLK